MQKYFIWQFNRVQLFHDGDFVPKLALETVIAHVLALRHLCCRRYHDSICISLT